MIKQQYINEETGEVLAEEIIANPEISKSLKKKIVDDMLGNAESIDDIDSNMLYAWCKITKEINHYGQIRLLGSYRDSGTEKKLIEDITLTGYVMRIIDKAHNFSGMLKSNHKTFITTWTKLWEDIGCGTNKRTQSKIKKFLVAHSIVREFKIGGVDGKLVNRLILNPFLFRGASHSSQISVMVFQDFIKESINMNSYPIRLLQSWGYISEDI